MHPAEKSHGAEVQHVKPARDRLVHRRPRHVDDAAHVLTDDLKVREHDLGLDALLGDLLLERRDPREDGDDDRDRLAKAFLGGNNRRPTTDENQDDCKGMVLFSHDRAVNVMAAALAMLGDLVEEPTLLADLAHGSGVSTRAQLPLVPEDTLFSHTGLPVPHSPSGHSFFSYFAIAPGQISMPWLTGQQVSS